jgi:nicotinamide mononucleotide transporter
MTLWGINTIELIAVALGIASVTLTIYQNIWCWPVGLAMVSIYIYIFFGAKLYSDAGLHAVYVVLQLYGWHQWLRGGPRDQGLPVTRLRPSRFLLWAGVGLVGTAALGTLMHRLTDAVLPYWDAATTSLSLVAQWLMARKVLESWVFWLVVDVMAVGIYTRKQLYPTAVLYLIFLALATWGLFAWLKSYRPRPTAPATA